LQKTLNNVLASCLLPSSGEVCFSKKLETTIRLVERKGNDMTDTTTSPKYDVLVADPPWDIEQKGKKRGAEKHYNLMSLQDIKDMDDAVKSVTADDSHCWLWVTNATLRHGYDVLEAWGYTPRSILTWCKPRFTLGNYLRNATEHVLLGTRGKAPVGYRSQPTWMFAPLQDHSHKPEELYAVIERVSGHLGAGKKLELFARRKEHGYDVWGNEIKSDVSFADFGYPVPSDA
jgi:N6-adenosine-specific RNA methylase IME4